MTDRDWQPIETAPMDHEVRILLYCARWIPCSMSGAWRELLARDGNGNIVWDGSGFQADGLDYPSTIPPFAPTHWMPLPEPPAALNPQETTS